MCFSLLQVPRCRFHTFASSWAERFHNIRRGGNSSSFNLLGSSTYGLEGGTSKRWSRRPITTKTERNKKAISSKTSNIRQDLPEETISPPTKLTINRLEASEYKSIQHCDIAVKIAENRELAKLITVIVFDIETTGLSRENERIIEIALQDLDGGENSTFQTLVNPERLVPNIHIHGISSHMVTKPEIPRMKELIPILLRYVRSRQKPGGQILWVAHNCRIFDVPFLIKEFSRCSFEIPPDWLFVDTMSLARELVKSGGPNVPSKISLQSLREFFEIPLNGSAHRAMSDVYALSLVLQKLTFALKMPIFGLIERSFTASDLINR